MHFQRGNEKKKTIYSDFNPLLVGKRNIHICCKLVVIYDDFDPLSGSTGFEPEKGVSQRFAQKYTFAPFEKNFEQP